MELYGISKEQIYLFNNGKDYESYNIFGAHKYQYNNKWGVRFSVYAPNAKSVSVVCNLNHWDKNANKLSLFEDTGVWVGFYEDCDVYEVYKYCIETASGEFILKSDPYAFWSEVRPATASRVYDLNGFKWTDEKFLKEREKRDFLKEPMNIYEVHLGSFKQRIENEYREHEDDVPIESYYNYRELADIIIPYVKKMGYTHIELMPLMEYPYDGSWGYQTTGYFSITSRYGEPKDFMHFVNECHKEGIFVIMDWVPGHFCKDEHGLYKFDGKEVYDGKEHKHWGTMTFNYAKKEVLSFLFSSAFFYLNMFHADGIRVDGVSSMLYLNYGVENPAERVFNKYGDEGNLEAISFLQEFNRIIGENFKGVITIAEESTAWPNVTKPQDIGGLGFHYKWDMGWMNDTLNYMRTDFPWREQEHGKFTFSMMYADAENYILPLSHDEVVHGKCSIINKMPGDYDEKFAGDRNLLLYQMTRPKAKLNFMGNEIAQFVEWKYYRGLDFNLLEFDKHKKFQNFIKDLNHYYLKEKSLWELDFEVWDGFQWIDADNRYQNIFIYERKGKELSDRTIIFLNFSKNSYEKFRFGVSLNGVYEEEINTNDEQYGGNNTNLNKNKIKSDKLPFHNKEYSIEISVPKLSGMVFKLKELIEDEDEKKDGKKKLVKSTSNTKKEKVVKKKSTTKEKVAKTTRKVEPKKNTAKKDTAKKDTTKKDTTKKSAATKQKATKTKTDKTKTTKKTTKK